MRDLVAGAGFTVLAAAVLCGLLLTAGVVRAPAPEIYCVRWHQAVGGSFYFDFWTGKHNGGFALTTVCDQYDLPPPALAYLGP